MPGNGESPSNNDDNRRLVDESPDLLDTSPPTTFGSVLQHHSPPRPRPGYYARTSGLSLVPSIEEENERHYTAKDDTDEDIADTFDRRSSASHGLGIAGTSPPTSKQRRVSIQSIPRVAVGTKSPPGPKTPGSADPLISQTDELSRLTSFSGATRYEGGGGDIGDYPREHGYSHSRNRSIDSLNSPYQQYTENPDTQRLKPGAAASVRTTRSAYESDFRPHACPSHGPLYLGRSNWLALSIMVLAVYSTVFSGIYLAVALRGPRYSKIIGVGGSMSLSTASTLTALFAKTIELSFVTVFVAFLGQVVSRRALMKSSSKGVTLAEMSMRGWIMQPGTMITHWESVRYAALSILGVVSLLAAIIAMLYTTASDALVSPQLKEGYRDGLLAGQVKTSFANSPYVQKHCSTPIRGDEHGGNTCLQIEHAAQGYQNYQRYLAYWNDLANQGNGSIDQAHRPQGFGLMNTNTSITAQWVDHQPVKKVTEKDFIANNVTLAMPHSGVFKAARDAHNGILQPEQLGGQGYYSIRASVPNPVINVLCMQVDAETLEPMIYDMWPNATAYKKKTTGPEWQVLQGKWHGPPNKTNIDDFFGWNRPSEPGEEVIVPPIFPRLPKSFNTILNHTGPYIRDSIYLLGRGGALGWKNQTDVFVLCSLKVAITTNCSTRYNASSSGGSMEAICGDPNDNMRYNKRHPDPVWDAAGTSTPVSLEWKNIASEWGNSLALNHGVDDGDSSNARLLTQLILSGPELNAALPSVAEALAVMAGCTLLMSAEDSSFTYGPWNYSLPELQDPQWQYFNASIRAQEYASGGANSAQRGWILVLLLVFAMNVLTLVYFIINKGLVTDFSEPPNLFSLAVNSPPSECMTGSCGGGPYGAQYKVKWQVSREGDHLFMESKDVVGESAAVAALRDGRLGGAYEMENRGSPIQRMYSKLSKRKSIL